MHILMMRNTHAIFNSCYQIFKLTFLKSHYAKNFSFPYSTRSNKRGQLCGNEIMSLHGKLALITGGTSGIGLATASEFLRCGACHVFVTGIEPHEGKEACRKLKANYGSKKCTFLYLNVISEKQFRNVLQYVEKNFGRIDILFNNAGILEDRKWELEVETNFKAMIRANLLGLEFMRKKSDHDSTSRIIINNADIYGVDPLPSAPIYSATKAGVIGVSKCFGSKYHYEQTGVRVVGLCCAATETNLVNEAAKKQLSDKWGGDTFNFITRNRLLKPDLIARGIVYIVKHAPTNTIWTIENSQLYLTKFPKRSTYNFMVSNL